MSLEPLLAALADGQFHSGDALGVSLGVSRTAIWKQIKKIEALGLPLESVKGKGYCITGGLDLLDQQVISKHLTNDVAALIECLDIVQVIDSTNVRAMEKAMAGEKAYICTAEQQTAGRGRRGKAWVSPFASNLYFSIVWAFNGGAAALEGLSLAVGVAVANALKAAGVDAVGLKWPNDVLHNNQKLSGVLLEMVGDAAGPCQVVVGVGVNVNMSRQAGGAIDQPWIDVASLVDGSVNRSELLALLLNELIPMLQQFEQSGFGHFRESWQQLDCYAGEDVAISLGHEKIIGRACGVDERGAIIIETDTGRRSFNGGEVSLRAVTPL